MTLTSFKLDTLSVLAGPNYGVKDSEIMVREVLGWMATNVHGH